MANRMPGLLIPDMDRSRIETRSVFLDRRSWKLPAPLRGTETKAGCSVTSPLPIGASIPTGNPPPTQARVGTRGRSRIRQGEVARATRGLLSGAASSGITGNIELDLDKGILRFVSVNKDSPSEIVHDEWS